MFANSIDRKSGFCPHCGGWIEEKNIEGECMIVDGIDLYGEPTSWEEYNYKTTCKLCNSHLEGHYLHDPIKGVDKLIWKEDRES